MTVTSWTDDDEELWRELRTAVHESDAVDPRHVAAARAAFSWRTVDAELLMLSDAAESDAALVRGSDPAEGRFSLFLGATTSIELELADGHAIGQVLPVRACRLVKGSVDGEVAEIDVDDTGFFRFRVSDREKFRLHLEADGKAHVTQWVTV